LNGQGTQIRGAPGKFFLAGGALLLGIPVYNSQRHKMSRPQQVPPYPMGEGKP
jgi:hypothetical protein